MLHGADYLESIRLFELDFEDVDGIYDTKDSKLIFCYEKYLRLRGNKNLK